MTKNVTRWTLISFATILGILALGWALYHFTANGFYIYGLVLIVAAAILGATAVVVAISSASNRSPLWTYLGVLGFLLVAGIVCLFIAALVTAGAPGAPPRAYSERFLHPQVDDVTITYVTGIMLLTLFGIGLFLGFVEYALLPAIGSFRLGAISRATYYEGLLQPFTIIILVAGLLAIGISARLSFFTYDEDFKMFRDVASSFIFLFSLPILIFASTKVIDEEIENRTMLTLMAKPVERWQVILGKYLGILLLMLVCVMVLGSVTAVTSYLRYFDDKLIDYRLAAPGSQDRIILDAYNMKAFYALLPGAVLAFLQLATLAAISVAVSTRFGLAANVTVVVVIYVAANVVQWFSNTNDLSWPVALLVTSLNHVLPSLGLLDLNQRLVFGEYALGPKDVTLLNPLNVPNLAQVWQYVGISVVYSIFYVGAALSLGMALFRTRELS